MLETLTLDSFAQQLDTPFQVERAGTTVTLMLVEAAEVRAARGWEAFSLIFRGPADAFFPQGSYSFRHDAFGDFELFFTPIGQDQFGFSYEAVFSRQRGQEQL